MQLKRSVKKEKPVWRDPKHRRTEKAHVNEQKRKVSSAIMHSHTVNIYFKIDG